MSLIVDEYGARLHAVTVRHDGGNQQISVDDHAGAVAYHGASIGRWANRIADSRFELDGTIHELAPNEGEHQLHGGPGGFHSRRWQGQADVDGDRCVVELTLTSPAGDQGFPGEVTATATIGLQGSRLSIDYHATATAVTPINLTNHLYWNLAGTGSLSAHELMVAADRYVEVNDELIPVAGPARLVDGTRFDCRTRRDLGSIVDAGGFDHCFLLNDQGAAAVTSGGPQVVLRHANGLGVAMHTDQMGVQVYTGQHLDPNRRAIALEAQRLPDMVNRPDFGDPFLRPGDDYRASTTFDVLT